MAILCIAFMGEKLKWRHVNSTLFQASLHITFPLGKQWSESSPNFPHQNKGFINYVFCRNWAVRNPAGTRLDSSLVNKQVESGPAVWPAGPLCTELCPAVTPGTRPASSELHSSPPFSLGEHRGEASRRWGSVSTC